MEKIIFPKIAIKNTLSNLATPLSRRWEWGTGKVKILLVEDDEDDYILFRDILAEIKQPEIQLDWVDSYKSGLESVLCDRHDIYVIDFRLQFKNGLELLQEMKQSGCRKPIIMLTGQGDRRIDFQAMRLGVADYAEKDKLTPYLLERTFRYALERYKTMEALHNSRRQLRFLSEKLIESQEAEHKRIAKELHDSIGSSLTAIKYGLEKQRRDEAATTGLKESPLTPLLDLVKSAIDEVRQIYSELRPLILDDMGILSAIKWYCRKCKEIYGNIHFENHLTIPEDQVPELLKIVIYRILQEALTNAVKHAKPNLIRIEMTTIENNRLSLTITDDGEGFDSDQAFMVEDMSTGMGLISMKERTVFSGGKFEIRSHKNQGTSVQATWPLT